MSVLVLTSYDDAFALYGDRTSPTKEAYARRHGYSCLIDRSCPSEDRPPAWSKVRLLERLLPLYDWCFWTDADAAVMYADADLSRFQATGADLVISQDANGVNTGVFLVRRSAAVLDLLRETWRRDEYVRQQYEEQASFVSVLRGWTGRVALVPQSSLNVYPDAYRPGMFVLHFAGPLHKQRFGEFFP